MSDTKNHKSIAGKFSVGVFVLVLGLGMLFLLINEYISYVSEIKELEREIDQIQESHVPFLVSSLWLTDFRLVEQQIESIVRFPYIHRVEIVNDEGRVYTAGPAASGEEEKQVEQLVYAFRETEVPLGTLTIFIDVKTLRKTVLLKIFRHMGAHIVLSLVTAVFISFFFQWLIGRHLRFLSQTLKNDLPEKFSQPITLDRRSGARDELAYLVGSLNNMRSDLKSYIDDKDMLIREVHHRIKNNMLVLDSILQMHCEELSGGKGRDAIEETQSRLQSMLILYDKLYRTENICEMSAAEYIPDLVEEIVGTNTGQFSIDIRQEIADLIFPVKILSSLGIILNELITNSIKHSFKGKSSGEISVSIEAVSGNTARLVYLDNGNKIPSSILAGDSRGLGMLLIMSLAEQIGTLDVNTEEGNRTIVTFQYLL